MGWLVDGQQGLYCHGLNEVILSSAIPGVVAVMLLGVGIKEENINQAQSIESPRVLSPLRWSPLSVPMQHQLMDIDGIHICTCF